MRVVCIKDGTGKPNEPSVIKGNVYTVIDQIEIKNTWDGSFRYKDGTYYKLIEYVLNWAHSDLFVVINEDQQDETEFEREGVVKEMKAK